MNLDVLSVSRRINATPGAQVAMNRVVMPDGTLFEDAVVSTHDENVLQNIFQIDEGVREDQSFAIVSVFEFVTAIEMFTYHEGAYIHRSLHILTHKEYEWHLKRRGEAGKYFLISIDKEANEN